MQATTTRITPFYFTVHDRETVVYIVRRLLDEATGFRLNGNGEGRGAKITVMYQEDKEVVKSILKEKESNDVTVIPGEEADRILFAGDQDEKREDSGS